MTHAHLQRASDVQMKPAGPAVVRERLHDGCVSEKTRMLSEIPSIRSPG